MTTLAEADAPPAAETQTAARGLRRSTVYTVTFAFFGGVFGIRRLTDNSFMWHVRTGEWILDHGIPHSDPYSFTAPGTHWVAQSWLAELLYGIISRTAGDVGLRFLGAFVGALLGALLYRTALRACGTHGRAVGFAALAFGCVINVWSERPLMLGLLAMAVLVYAVEFEDTWLARHPMVVIPVLMWCWVNVHGTFALGFLYLALHLVGRAVDGHLPTSGRERTLLQASVLAGVVTLVNPYGVSLPLFPVALMARSGVLRDVAEWQSPQFRNFGPLLFAVFIFATLVVFARTKPSRRDILIGVVFLLLGLWALRNIGLAGVVVMPILARNAGPGTRAAADLPARVNTLAALAVVALGMLIAVNALGQPAWDLHGYPVDATRALHDQNLLGRRLATTDIWGGYLIATEYPQQRVFYDDRYDMYPIAINDAYRSLLDARPDWSATLDKYRIDVVMWPADAPLTQLLAESSGWVRVYGDATAVVFRRTAQKN